MLAIPRLRQILLLGGAMLALPGAAAAAPHVARQVIVRFEGSPPSRSPLPGARMSAATGSPSRLLTLPRGHTIGAALRTLRKRAGVRYAAPNYVAHAASFTPPDDPGASNDDGWEAVQWNFLARYGVDALGAWAHAAKAHRPGGLGVRIAVLDTGIAYRDWGRFRASPDFGRTRFVGGYDFVVPGAPPVDHNGHGTHVAGTIAESTDNGIALTGLAYNASIIPVRVLNYKGEGTETRIARGIRYAVRQHAKIINLSVEFDEFDSAQTLPELVSAIRYARSHGVLIVAAAGNEGKPYIAYPAGAPGVLSVGASTDDRCLATDSNYGAGIDLVAPGGGVDSPRTGEANCDPNPKRSARDIYQMTFTSSISSFGLPGGYEGTSMASAHVAATAALVIASGVIGRHPTPRAIERRLARTAHDLGPVGYDRSYGAGLIDAGAATDPRVR